MASKIYYNEYDVAAATWLRELMAENLIPAGDIDTRSIKDVRSDDLRGYDSCHFFAGIGIWPAALRRAGWPDARPVWTGSCPCQPFSAAGKNLGFDDPRHLWPDWFRLIAERRPHQVFGEQVATAGAWLDLVRADLEGLGAAFGSPDLPAAGFAQGAHIRQRAYWMADFDHAERWADLAGGHFGDWPQAGRVQGYGEPGAGGAAGGLADASGREPWDGELQPSGQHRQQQEDGGALRCGDHGGLAHHQGVGLRQEHAHLGGGASGDRAQGLSAGFDPSCADGRLGHHHQGSSLGSWTPDERGAVRVQGPASGATGSLRGCDWLLCHDARIRPVEAGTFPLAASHPGRLGLLRGYGNALDLETAVNFVEAFIEAEMLS